MAFTPSNDSAVLVTGGTGFVGSAVVRALLGRGERVRCLVRASSLRANLDSLDVEIAQGDLRDSVAVAGALKDCRGLYHVAADYRLWATDPEEIVRANLDGTRTIMEAALAAGTPRIVYTSSVATLKPGSAEAPTDETQPLSAYTAIGAYKRSKVVAERLVERMVAERALPAVIVNPSTPIGPRDIKPTPTGRVILEAARGRMPAFVETGMNLVHVDDVAAGHLLAFDKGAVGERYILGGENVSLRQMLADIAALVGRKPPTISLPRGPLYPLAFAAEAVARVTKKEPFLNVDALRMSEHTMFFASDKARAALGYQPRPYREGLADAVAWFRDTGRLT